MVDEVVELDPQEDRRADLEAAIASVEAESTEPVSEPSDTPSVSPAGDRPVSEQAAPNLDEGQQQEPQSAEAPKRQKPLTAPIDWKPELRAEFGKLPAELQQAIHQREVHVNQVLQQSAESRRMAESLVRTVEPYRALMVAEGVNDPLQAVDGLLKTAAALSMGSPAQKAQRLAQLVGHYGVDIEMLDKALAGSLPKNTEEDRIAQLVEQRMQPVNQLLNQFQQAQQQQHWQVQQQAVQSVEQMAENPQFPHFDVVREIMADFVDLAAGRGEPLTLEDAYQRACMTVPQIAQQYVQQQSGSFMQGQQQRVDHKRNAASSIVGRANSGSTGKTDLSSMSLRETIEAQMAGGGRI